MLGCPFRPALNGAKLGIHPLGNKRPLAILAHPQRMTVIRQFEGQNHLDAHQQRMKIPNNGGLVSQLNMISRSIPIKRSHSLAVQI